MKPHLYAFGYKPPEFQGEWYEDFEAIGAFLIDAETEVQALEWGRKLSKWYILQLYGVVSNADATAFASWIEQEPDPSLYDVAAEIGTIPATTYPDFKRVRSTFLD